MLIQIDLNSEETLYNQLANQIRSGIARGYLNPGETLPSIRNLASELGINLHTVSKTYNKLKEEGVIVINRGKGVKVSDQVLLSRNNGYTAILYEKITNLVSESLCNGVEKKEFINMTEEVYKEMGRNK